MNDEIKVNDYVRTKDGYIAKVIKKDKDGWYHCDSTVEECYEDDFKFFKKGELDITKHSPNIIDLIEVGDIVEILLDKETNKTTLFCFESQKQIDMLNNKDCRQITGIVTKEQFEKVMYRVEGQ